MNRLYINCEYQGIILMEEENNSCFDQLIYTLGKEHSVPFWSLMFLESSTHSSLYVYAYTIVIIGNYCDKEF